jgi:hypothetical protein
MIWEKEGGKGTSSVCGAFASAWEGEEAGFSLDGRRSPSAPAAALQKPRSSADSPPAHTLSSATPAPPPLSLSFNHNPPEPPVAQPVTTPPPPLLSSALRFPEGASCCPLWSKPPPVCVARARARPKSANAPH